MNHPTTSTGTTPARPDTESPVSLSDDLITKVLSFIDVKSLMQMRCVCKSWKSIISDPEFIKLHLKRSAQNPYLTLSKHSGSILDFIPFLVSDLIIENPRILLSKDLYSRCQVPDFRCTIGSCNGLICLVHKSAHSVERVQISFLFWNPIMGYMSKELVHFLSRDDKLFKFVYDNSSETYMVVMLMLDIGQNRTHVRVLSVGDNVLKTIPNFPAVPLHYRYGCQFECYGVYLNGRLSCLAIQDRPVRFMPWEDIKANELVIVSLDMKTEVYTKLMPPSAFDEMSSVMPPSLCILKDSVCFSHDFRKTEFIIWKMKINGVEEPWTQLLKISYQNLRTRFHDFADFKTCPLLPLHLSDHNDTLILANNLEERAILYNLRDNTAKRTRIMNKIEWFSTRVYVESLVTDIQKARQP